MQRWAGAVAGAQHARQSGASLPLASVVSLLAAPGPQTAALYVAPVVFNGSLLGPVNGGNGEPAAWFVTQWDSVAALPTVAVAGANASVCATPPDATLWWDASPTAAVCMASADAPGGALSVSMAEDGAVGGLACGSEFDTFVCPTNPIYAGVVPNLLIDRVNGTLANFSSLTLAFTMRIAAAATAARCGAYPQCGPSGKVDYGYGVAAVALSNAAARQTLFYQVILWDTRIIDCPAASPCVPFANFFFTTLPTLGVSESIAALPGAPPCLQPGAPPTAFSLDIYPRLTRYLAQAAAEYGADGDAAHWVVGDLYIGTGLEGSTTVASEVSGVALVAQRN